MNEGSPLPARAKAFAAVSLALAVLLCSTSAVSAAGDPGEHGERPRIVELYPDTPEPRHTGEYVAVEFPEPTNTSGWSLEDRYRETPLPDRSLEGVVYFGREGAPRNHSIGTVRLAADGDEVTLRSPSREIDAVRYGDLSETAPSPSEGELLVRAEDGWRVRHVDAAEHGFEMYPAEKVKAYVTPDSGDTGLEALEEASDEVVLAGFRFDSTAAANALEDVVEGGSDVELLLEGGPPGGFENESADIVDGLVAEGADATVFRGSNRPYRYMHAKYAVVDDEVSVVSSENWHDGALADGGRGTRGWGVVVESDGVSDHLGRVFESDVEADAAVDWRDAGFDAHEGGGFTGQPPDTDFGSRLRRNVSVGVFTAPDVAVEETKRLLSEADDRVYVQQAYVRNWSDGGNPFVDELVDAARRGVEVRLQMDGRWYVEDENQGVMERLNAAAEDDDLPFEVRLSPAALHNKGFVVDGERVVVSSVNWNENSPTENREVAVVVEDAGVAGYYEEVFLRDWRADSGTGGQDRVPVSDVLLEALVAVLASGAGVWLVYRET